MAIAVCAPAAIVLSNAEASNAQSVVLVVPPWRSAIQIATSAGGSILAPGVTEAVVFTHSKNRMFTDELYRLGAWMVLNGELSQFLCIDREDPEA
ncbi:MAG: hypothetical protein AAF479_15745 [Pseudomonadota bacterium]